MEQNDFMRECLKFSFGIISHIFEFTYAIDDESYINLILPVVYYLLIFKN